MFLSFFKFQRSCQFLIFALNYCSGVSDTGPDAVHNFAACGVALCANFPMVQWLDLSWLVSGSSGTYVNFHLVEWRDMCSMQPQLFGENMSG